VVDVLPFRGLRYNLKQIDDLSGVITPPYDVISPEEQESYYERNPLNVIRLEYGKEYPGDSPRDNKYIRSAIILKKWIEQDILVQDEQPAFYLVDCCYPHQGDLKSYRVLIARVRLEDWSTGQIRPHEATRKEPQIDRLRLTQMCRVNLSPVMGIFREEGNLFSDLSTSTSPLRAVDNYGVTYTMRVLVNASVISIVSSYFKDKIIYIADGHHRYETALAYQKLNKTAHSFCTGREGFNFVMMALAGSQDILTLPYHRLVRGLREEMLAQLDKRLSAYFEIEELPLPGENWQNILKAQEGVAFGLYGLHKRYLYLIRKRKDVRWVMPLDIPGAWGDLDVGVLHGLILREMLGVDSLEGECLEYTHDERKAISQVDSGEYQLAFLLNPTPVESILTTADKGMRMPPKSTYFYPKMPAGLVINSLWDGKLA